MANSINIKLLSYISDEKAFNNYLLTVGKKRKKDKKMQKHEIESLIEFVIDLENNGLSLNDFDGFYVSYKPTELNKEFDLLKLNDNLCINIELKSKTKADEEVKKQLLTNKYYLTSLDRDLLLFAYDSSTGNCNFLSESEELIQCDINDIVNSLRMVSENYEENIEEIFNAAKFIVSPTVDLKRFIDDNYCLTDTQLTCKDRFINSFNISESSYYAITGEAGTGKTLLLYDIIKKLCNRKFNILLVHCGKGNKEWRKIEHEISGLTINSISSFDIWAQSYFRRSLIVVDEAQRIYETQLLEMIDKTSNENTPILFSYDKNQYLSTTEEVSRSVEIIKELTTGGYHYKLNNRIRTNASLWSCIEWFMDLNKEVELDDLENFHILKTDNSDDTVELINYFKNQSYTFINFTKSNYSLSPYKAYAPLEDTDTHKVIGREYDKVVIVIKDSFYYDTDLKISAHCHPVRKYLYTKLLFQALTRAKESIVIIIENNNKMFNLIYDNILNL